MRVAPTGQLTLQEATISGGRAIGTAFNDLVGGGLWVEAGGTAVLNNSTLSDNEANYGAGIFNEGTLQLNQTSISGNRTNTGNLNAILNGGALLNTANATINHSTISNNQMTPSNSYTRLTGGGIINWGLGIMHINHSTISGNRGSMVGGGIFNYGTDDLRLTINHSTISDNEAWVGGGINNRGWLSLNNSTISGNSVSLAGGGIYSFANPDPPYDLGLSRRAKAYLHNSTIVGNRVTASGTVGAGGIGSGNDLTLQRTIITGNSAPPRHDNSNTSEVYNLGAGIISASSSHNVVGYGGSSRSLGWSPTGTNVVPAGALATVLNPDLADNGGPTLTHALVTGSPAIDIAPAPDCSGAPINGVDQRGVFRSQDGNGDGTAACDAGAVEMGQLQCGIQAASKPFPLTFAQSSNVLVSVTDAGTDLDCVRVTEIGHNHPHATSSMSNMALETGRYWQIAGYQNSTSATPAAENFMVDLTLPFASADANSRACKWLGVAPPAIGFGWDCDDGSNTTPDPDVSVTRTGVDSFSDWAVGDNVGPTAVSLQSINAVSQQGGLAALMATLLTALSGIWLWARRPG